MGPRAALLVCLLGFSAQARLHVGLRDFPTARNTLAPVLSSNYRPQVRERARSLMGQVVRMEEAYSKRGNPPVAPPVATGPPTASGGSPLPVGVQWVFRELRSGEQRIEGVLERIDCARPSGITLVVRADGGVKRFTAAQFSDIDFITYREQQGGSISCGERKPPTPSTSPGFRPRHPRKVLPGGRWPSSSCRTSAKARAMWLARR